MEKKFLKILLIGQFIFTGLCPSSAAGTAEGIDCDSVCAAASNSELDAVFLSVDTELAAGLVPCLYQRFKGAYIFGTWWRSEEDVHASLQILKKSCSRLAADGKPKDTEDFSMNSDTVLFMYSYQEERFVLLNWCLCRVSPFEQRMLCAKDLITAHEAATSAEWRASLEICHVEFGSGWLKQLYYLMRGLQSRGFKRLLLIGIDPLYLDASKSNYVKDNWRYLAKAAECDGKCILKLYPSASAFLTKFPDDFPDYMTVDSVAAIDLGDEKAFADLSTILSDDCVRDDTILRVSSGSRLMRTRAEIAASLKGVAE